MRAAVTASGGVVVGDLSAIDALAVVPSSAGFDGRVSSKQSVTNLFADTLIGADRHDGMRAGGHGGDPGDGPQLPAWPTHGTCSSSGTTTG